MSSSPQSKQLTPGTVVVFHKAPPFNDEVMEGSLAIFESAGHTSYVQFWIHKATEKYCTLCTVNAEYEILGEL